MINIMWASLVPALFIIGCLDAQAMTEIEKAAVIGVDKVLCLHDTPKEDVQSTIIAASRETGLSVDAVYMAAGEIGGALMGQLKDSGRVDEYCGRVR